MPVLSKNRQKIVEELTSNNIEVRPLIAGNIANKPVWYEKYGFIDLPNANLIDKFGFYLPNHQDLKVDDINKIIEIVNKNV
jgi:CDP-6-deoxy-D-xylo-4-hexulose-3-dehydrase